MGLLPGQQVGCLGGALGRLRECRRGVGVAPGRGDEDVAGYVCRLDSSNRFLQDSLADGGLDAVAERQIDPTHTENGLEVVLGPRQV